MSRQRKERKEGRVEEDSQEKGSKKSNNLEKCCIAVGNNKNLHWVQSRAAQLCMKNQR